MFSSFKKFFSGNAVVEETVSDIHEEFTGRFNAIIERESNKSENIEKQINELTTKMNNSKLELKRASSLKNSVDNFFNQNEQED